jgi:tetratricopeptide (TPR) repeat protein
MDTNGYRELLKRGEGELVYRAASVALEKNPADRPALVALAKLALAQGDLEPAAALLNEAEALGVDADSELLRAALTSEQGQREQALQLFEALTLRPDASAEAFIGFGRELAARGELDRARTAFHRAAQRDPQSGVPHCFLARLSIEEARLDQAVEHLQVATALSPGYPLVAQLWAALREATS